MDSINRTQILIGITGICIGSLVYFFDRPPESAYFFSNFFEHNLFDIFPQIFGVIGYNLPSFIHVFSFTLITAGILNCGRRGCLIVCCGWISIDSTFEIGQKCKDWSANLVPDWFNGIPFLENSRDYFIHGTFDYLDLVAMSFGAVMAYVFLWRTADREVFDNENKKQQF